MSPEYIGVCTAALRTGLDPYVRLRVPEVTEEYAAEVAVDTAHLRRDPALLLPVAIPDDARELATADE